MADAAWRSDPAGVVLAVRVQPRARRNAIGGCATAPQGLALKISVTAPPADGKANEAVVAMLAAALEVAKRDVRLLAGATARTKSLRIGGEPARIAAKLQELLQT